MSPPDRGSLLIVSMWILTILSLVALGVATRIKTELKLTEYQIDDLTLRQVAKGTLSYLRDGFAHEEMKFNDAGDFLAFIQHIQLKSVFSEQAAQVQLQMEDESGKLNLNKASKVTLLNLLKALEVEDSNATAWIDHILDWRDNEKRTDYLSSGYNYPCKNAPFQSVEELLLVMGTTRQNFEKVRPYLTVSGDGKVNINTASRAVLKALNFSESQANSLVEARGYDPQSPIGPNEETIKPLKDLRELSLNGIHLPPKTLNRLSSVSESLRLHIRSQKTNASTKLEIDVVVSKNTLKEPFQINQWYEY